MRDASQRHGHRVPRPSGKRLAALVGSEAEEGGSDGPRAGRLAQAQARWLSFLLVGSLLGLTPPVLLGQVQPEPSLEEGKRTFELQCVACHTIGGGVRLGPDLQGVTERRDLAWLRRFIRNPDLLLAEKDSIAVAILQRFGIPMPNLGLTEQQVDAVIAYLATTKTAPVARPALFVPTLVVGALAVVGLTLIGLAVGTKRVEIRP